MSLGLPPLVNIPSKSNIGLLSTARQAGEDIFAGRKDAITNLLNLQKIRSDGIKEKVSDTFKFVENEKEIMSTLTDEELLARIDMLKQDKTKAAILDALGGDKKTIFKRIRASQKKEGKRLPGELLLKMPFIEQAGKDSQELLNSFKSGEIEGDSFRAAGTKVVSLLPKFKIIRVKLDLIRESLGRALTGAAMPESEVAAFKRAFGVNTTDTDEIIELKLGRIVGLVDRVRELAGLGDEEGIQKLKGVLSKETSIIKKAKSAKKTFAGITEDDLNKEERKALMDKGLL